MVYTGKSHLDSIHPAFLGPVSQGLEQLSKVGTGTVHAVADGRLNQGDLVNKWDLKGTSFWETMVSRENP